MNEVNESQNTMQWQRVILGALAIVLLGFAAYFPVIRGGFIWDDEVMLTGNAAVQTIGGLRDIWFSLSLSDYLPMTFSTFWLEYRLWGLNPAGYHVVNLLLHGFSALLLWRLFVGLKVPGAWLAAAVFAVHPVNATSVVWIAERKNTLSMVFFLATLLLYLRFEQERRERWYWLSVFSFLLAMWSKTSVVVLPILLLGWAWWQRRKISAQDIYRTIPFFVISIALGIVGILIQKKALGGDMSNGDGLLVRVLGGTWGVWFYLYKTLLPVNLMMIYPRWEIDPRSFLAYLPGTLWLVALAVCWRFRGNWGRPVLAGLLFFWLMLSPILGVFNLSFYNYSRVAGHWQYLSTIGIVALVVGGMAAIWRTQSPSVKKIKILCATLLLSGLVVLSQRQAFVLADSEMLWRDSIKRNPKAWMAYNNLGYTLATHKNDNLAALGYYEKAVQLQPNYPNGLSNYGHALSELGRNEEAIVQLEKALRLKPDHIEAHNNLGNALSNLGKNKEAIAHYETALRFKPDHVDAHNNLGVALAMSGKFSEGVAHLAKALELNPNSASAHSNMGNALAIQQKIDDAILHYRSALRIKSDDAKTHNNLANALAGKGKFDEAIEHYQTALRLEAHNPEAYYNMGIALLRKGNRDEAIYHFKEALRQRPNYVDAQRQLAAVVNSPK